MKKTWDKVILIGFRGAGKTTVGKLLAESLNLPFLDLDDEVQRRVGLSIKEMVERYGWSYFREMERAVLEDLIEKEGCVVALGGGSVLHEDFMEKLRNRAFIIYLKISPASAVERITKDSKSEQTRPSLSNLSLVEEVERVLEERAPLYEKYADIIIESDRKDLNTLLKEILKHLEGEPWR
jgi:shikimate kinase